MLRSFLAAARDGDLDQLVALLATDAAFYGDGGGKATAVRQPLFGAKRVANFVLALFKQVHRQRVTIEAAKVNGGPGITVHDLHGKIVSVFSLELADGVIQTLRGVVNPDKLQHLGTVSDIARLPRRDEGLVPEETTDNLNRTNRKESQWMHA